MSFIMLRFINIILLVAMGSMIVLLYQLKYESRLLSETVSTLSGDIQKERENIAVLRAEWSHLIRPERIEHLSKKHLGLTTIAPEQFVSSEWLGTVRKGSSPVVLDSVRNSKSSR